MFKVAIVTLSDKGHIGEREDITGKKLKEYIEKDDKYKVVKYDLIKDDKDMHTNPMLTQGTTPRRYFDLLASLCDLTSGSGDKGTPVVWVQGYFKNYAD